MKPDYENELQQQLIEYEYVVKQQKRRVNSVINNKIDVVLQKQQIESD